MAAILTWGNTQSVDLYFNNTIKRFSEHCRSRGVKHPGAVRTYNQLMNAELERGDRMLDAVDEAYMTEDQKDRLRGDIVLFDAELGTLVGDDQKITREIATRAQIPVTEGFDASTRLVLEPGEYHRHTDRWSSMRARQTELYHQLQGYNISVPVAAHIVGWLEPQMLDIFREWDVFREREHERIYSR